MSGMYAAVSKWERGKTCPTITLLQPLAYFFEVTLDKLNKKILLLLAMALLIFKTAL